MIPENKYKILLELVINENEKKNIFTINKIKFDNISIIKYLMN